MIDLLGIPFSEEAIEKIKTSLINYKRFAGVEFILSRWISANHFIVTIAQTSTPTGKTLTHDELSERAIDVFKDITPVGFEFMVKTHTHPTKQ